jgi:hypothetical protein
MFYVGVNHTATVKGSTAVAVRCEKCFQKYYYHLVCTAVGASEAPYGIGAEAAKKRARKQARLRLRRLLETEIAAVPCPHCGSYQEAMFPVLRKPRLKGLRKFGIVLLVIGGLAALVATAMTDRPNGFDRATLGVAWSIAPTLVLGGGGVLLLRRHKNATYDPNDPETEQERIELGRRLTITREQAEALTQEE